MQLIKRLGQRLNVSNYVLILQSVEGEVSWRLSCNAAVTSRYMHCSPYLRYSGNTSRTLLACQYIRDFRSHVHK